MNVSTSISCDNVFEAFTNILKWNQSFFNSLFWLLNWDRVSLMSPWTSFGNEISLCKLVKSYWAFYMTLNSFAIKISHFTETCFRQHFVQFVFLIFPNSDAMLTIIFRHVCWIFNQIWGKKCLKFNVVKHFNIHKHK
jgi:hypothetical protein